MSVSIAPGVSTLAFWVAQQILDGKDVPKDLVVPFLRIDQDNLEANLATPRKPAASPMSSIRRKTPSP
jgi:ribose transport system substrate-binding protein